MKRGKSTLQSIRLVSVVFFLFAAVFYLVHERYPFLRAQRSDTAVPVMMIHDGDTISVLSKGTQQKVRLIGIDAPEIDQKPWGEEAKRHLEAIVRSSGWKVRMEFDVEKVDQYGRTLAYVWTTDNRLINLLMVRDGFAFLYTVPPNVKHAEELKKAQEMARSNRVGIWSDDGLREKPRDYRKEHPRQ